MGEDEFSDVKKAHVKRKAGKKHDKKNLKNSENKDASTKHKNPKAFAIQNATKAERRVRRKEDISEKRAHQPTVDRTPLEPPPIVVAIVGPPKVGKSTLMKCLVKNFTRQTLTNIQGPVTIVSGKKRRLTLIECPNDINSMIDVAKVADLVLLLVDASFGFEMEIFEFLNICQVHGFPRIMGVLTHLDTFKNSKTLQRTKKNLKQRFWTEVYQGAKLFYLSGMVHGEYQKTEVHNLGRFISVMKFRPLIWRTNHPYLVADRVEDVTDPELLRSQPKVDRTVSVYGFLRGTNMKPNQGIHLAGVGDFNVKSMTFLPDPCPLPEGEKKRTLVEKDKSIYAPMSGVGGIVYDKDAVYIDLGGSQINKKEGEEAEIVQNIINAESTINEKLQESELRLFSGSRPIKSSEVGRDRRKVVFDDEEPEKSSDDDDDEDDDDSEEESQDSEEEDEPNPKKRRTDNNSVSIRNQQLLQEIGEDIDDSEMQDIEDLDDEVTSDKANAAESHQNTSFKLPKKLASDKDKQILSKVSEALSSIKDQSSESEDEESDSEDSANENLSEESADESEEDESKEGFFDEENEEDSGTASLKWKSDLAMKAQDSFYARQSGTASLRKLVYGIDQKVNTEDGGQEEDAIGGLFTMSKAKTGASKQELDGVDSSLWTVEHLQDWSSEQIKDRIRDCFVTGQWAKGRDAEELLNLDDEEEVYGDFEDLETGEVVEGAPKDSEDEDEDKPRMVNLGGEREAELAKRKERMERKLKLKKMFDSEYDGGDGEKASFYEDLKKEVDEQTNLNRSEFEGLDDSLRVQYEGYRPGMYMRLEIDNVPFELMEHFSPSTPLLVGGLLKGEDQLGYCQVRLKKHRWYPKILKNRDPLIVSLGWRRFQTLPIYSVCDHNMRQRMLKYTPEHLHCDAHFWGPITPQGTGVMAVQSVSDKQENFKIVATGVVLELDKTTQIVKKLKLTGEPFKVFKKTAFIKGMFNSSLEVAKFEKAAIRTVSGIRGMIKKNLSEPEGAFRATFEDKILMSDIVFVKTWFNVEVPKFYALVTNLLQPLEERSAWTGMRTVGQIKRDANIKNEVNKDSLYTEIKREERVFKPLTIPRNLQADLPYNLKPKAMAEVHDPTKERVAVVLDHKERKIQNAFKMLREISGQKHEKEQKDKKKRVKDFIAKKRIIEEKKMKRQKEARKQISRMVSKSQAKQERMMQRKGGRSKDQ